MTKKKKAEKKSTGDLLIELLLIDLVCQVESLGSVEGFSRKIVKRAVKAGMITKYSRSPKDAPCWLTRHRVRREVYAKFGEYLSAIGTLVI